MSMYEDAVTKIKGILTTLEPEVEGIEKDATTELSTMIKQVPVLVSDIVRNSYDAIIASAPSANLAAIIAAVEASALSTLATQGIQMLEQDYVAFKGMVLATLANKQATVAPAVTTEPDPAPVVE